MRFRKRSKVDRHTATPSIPPTPWRVRSSHNIRSSPRHKARAQASFPVVSFVQPLNTHAPSEAESR
eukprot:276145-Pyramimonas_sp.AAC.1